MATSSSSKNSRFSTLNVFKFTTKDPKPPPPPPKDLYYLQNNRSFASLSPDSLPASPIYTRSQYTPGLSPDVGPAQSTMSLVSSAASQRSFAPTLDPPKREKGKGFFNKFSKRNPKIPQSAVDELPSPSRPDENISMPWNFQHNIHVDDGLSGLPPSWSTSLVEAGFSEEEIAAIHARRAAGTRSPGSQYLYTDRPRSPAGSAPILARPSRSSSLPRQFSDASLPQPPPPVPSIPLSASASLSSSTPPVVKRKLPPPVRTFSSPETYHKSATPSISASSESHATSGSSSNDHSDDTRPTPTYQQNGITTTTAKVRDDQTTPPRRTFRIINASPGITSPPPAYSNSPYGYGYQGEVKEKSRFTGKKYMTSSPQSETQFEEEDEDEEQEQEQEGASRQGGERELPPRQQQQQLRRTPSNSSQTTLSTTSSHPHAPHPPVPTRPPPPSPPRMLYRSTSARLASSKTALTSSSSTPVTPPARSSSLRSAHSSPSSPASGSRSGSVSRSASGASRSTGSSAGGAIRSVKSSPSSLRSFKSGTARSLSLRIITGAGAGGGGATNGSNGAVVAVNDSSPFAGRGAATATSTTAGTAGMAGPKRTPALPPRLSLRQSGTSHDLSLWSESLLSAIPSELTLTPTPASGSSGGLTGSGSGSGSRNLIGSGNGSEGNGPFAKAQAIGKALQERKEEKVEEEEEEEEEESGVKDKDKVKSKAVNGGYLKPAPTITTSTTTTTKITKTAASPPSSSSSPLVPFPRSASASSPLSLSPSSLSPFASTGASTGTSSSSLSPLSAASMSSSRGLPPLPVPSSSSSIRSPNAATTSTPATTKANNTSSSTTKRSVNGTETVKKDGARRQQQRRRFSEDEDDNDNVQEEEEKEGRREASPPLRSHWSSRMSDFGGVVVVEESVEDGELPRTPGSLWREIEGMLGRGESVPGGGGRVIRSASRAERERDDDDDDDGGGGDRSAGLGLGFRFGFGGAGGGAGGEGTGVAGQGQEVWAAANSEAWSPVIPITPQPVADSAASEGEGRHGSGGMAERRGSAYRVGGNDVGELEGRLSADDVSWGRVRYGAAQDHDRDYTNRNSSRSSSSTISTVTITGLQATAPTIVRNVSIARRTGAYVINGVGRGRGQAQNESESRRGGGVGQASRAPAVLETVSQSPTVAAPPQRPMSQQPVRQQRIQPASPLSSTFGSEESSAGSGSGSGSASSSQSQDFLSPTTEVEIETGNDDEEEESLLLSYMTSSPQPDKVAFSPMAKQHLVSATDTFGGVHLVDEEDEPDSDEPSDEDDDDYGYDENDDPYPSNALALSPRPTIVISGAPVEPSFPSASTTTTTTNTSPSSQSPVTSRSTSASASPSPSSTRPPKSLPPLPSTPVTPMTFQARYPGWLSELVAPLEEFIDEQINPNLYYVDQQEIAEGESGSVFSARVVLPTSSTPRSTSPAPTLRLPPLAKDRDAADAAAGMTTLVAIKHVVLDPQGSTSNKLADLEKELHLLKGLCHESILSIDAVYVDLVEDSLWIRMELMERSLADVVELVGSGLMLHERMMARFASDVLHALEFLQDLRIAHRDVRSDNLLLNSKGILKLADFSNGAQVTSRSNMRSDNVGVAFWQAPEIRKPPYNVMKVDVWSLGATVWEMAEAAPPFSKTNQLADRWPPLSQPQLYSPGFHDFLRLCSEPAASRPEVKDLMKSPFIKNACGRPVIIQLLARCVAIEQTLLQEGGDEDSS